jgi:hypothetical protein
LAPASGAPGAGSGGPFEHRQTTKAEQITITA